MLQSFQKNAIALEQVLAQLLSSYYIENKNEKVECIFFIINAYLNSNKALSRVSGLVSSFIQRYIFSLSTVCKLVVP
jgi:hypothetical protein